MAALQCPCERDEWVQFFVPCSCKKYRDRQHLQHEMDQTWPKWPNLRERQEGPYQLSRSPAAVATRCGYGPKPIPQIERCTKYRPGPQNPIDGRSSRPRTIDFDKLSRVLRSSSFVAKHEVKYPWLAYSKPKSAKEWKLTNSNDGWWGPEGPPVDKRGPLARWGGHQGGSQGADAPVS